MVATSGEATGSTTPVVTVLLAGGAFSAAAATTELLLVPFPFFLLGSRTVLFAGRCKKRMRSQQGRVGSDGLAILRTGGQINSFSGSASSSQKTRINF